MTKTTQEKNRPGHEAAGSEKCGDNEAFPFDPEMMKTFMAEGCCAPFMARFMACCGKDPAPEDSGDSVSKP